MVYSKYHTDNSLYVNSHYKGNTANSYRIATNNDIQHDYCLYNTACKGCWDSGVKLAILKYHDYVAEYHFLDGAMGWKLFLSYGSVKANSGRWMLPEHWMMRIESVWNTPQRFWKTYQGMCLAFSMNLRMMFL